MILKLPFLLQGLVLLVDEFWFHHQRGLGRWERWGHPLDTLSVLLPVTVATFQAPRAPWRLVFYTLSVLSCFVVTKDEWIHAAQARPSEHWLHSLLFITHPMVFVSVWKIWNSTGARNPFLLLQFSALLLFMTYQLVWWCLLQKGRWPLETVENRQPIL
jgi:hypothetical protein